MHCCDSEIKKQGSFILACAGFGKRMGLEMPKQFLEYGGQPLFLKALLVAQKSPYIGEIVIAVQKEYMEVVKEICAKEGVNKLQAIVSGGKERQDSIFEALQAISGKFPYVYVQDAARPFCKEKYLKNCYQALENGYEGVIVGVKVKHTIKKIRDEKVVETLVRQELFEAHTPQGFQKDVLLEAYQKAKKEGFLGTDDASLVERLGYQVKVVFGDYDNIKITVPEDLKFFKTLVKQVRK